MKLYTIYDAETKEFSPPICQPHDVVAIRAFQMEVNDRRTGNMLNHAPEHFSIWRVGEWNTETGTLTKQLEKLSEAAALIKGN